MTPLDLDDAIAALRRGEVVGIPTDTVYGIVTLPRHSDRLYEVKGRPRTLELPVLIGDLDDAELSPAARRLAERFWPGKLTIVSGGVGYRIPGNDAARTLARAAGPLASTSANLHGAPPCTTAAQVRALRGVALVIDGGACEGAPSTVVRVDPFEVIREGAIPSADVEAAAGRH